MSGKRKVAVAGAVYGAVVIAALATQAVPFPTVWDGIVAIFALCAFGGGLFCLVLAYRHRADMPSGFRRVVSGLGVFFLVIGSLAVVALIVSRDGSRCRPGRKPERIAGSSFKISGRFLV